MRWLAALFLLALLLPACLLYTSGIPSASFGMYRGGGAHTREEWIEPSSLCGGMKAAASVLMNWFS